MESTGVKVTEYRELLFSKGFSLNSYHEGNFWELEVREKRGVKRKNM